MTNKSRQKRLMFISTCLAILMNGVLASPSAGAASSDDLTRLSGYAVVIGRAGGCGVALNDELVRVAMWIEWKFGESHQEYLEQFFQIVAENVQTQKSGKASEDCDKVLEITRNVAWP